MPQENGNKTDVRWIALTREDGAGLLVVGMPLIEASAHHYTAADLDAAQDLDRALEILADARLAPRFAEEELARERALVLSEISAVKEEPAVLADREFLRALIGEHPSRSGENRNVSDLSLPPGQTQLVQALADLGVPLAVVVFAGRPLAIPHEARLADALLYAWHPGSEGGYALADLLFGLAAPSGRLPITMPRRTGQVPIYYAHKPSGRPVGSTMEFQTRYVDLPHTPLFPFGFGLGYTTFAYRDLAISEPHMTGETQVSAAITNQGSLPGTETVQLYLRDLHASVTRPIKELKGFQRLELQPGETRRISFTISATDLVFTSYNDLPRVEPGEYQVWIGPNAAEGLQGSFVLDI